MTPNALNEAHPIKITFIQVTFSLKYILLHVGERLVASQQCGNMFDCRSISYATLQSVTTEVVGVF